MPDVLTYGVATFDPQSLRASDDIYNRLVAEWWPDAVSRRYGLLLNSFDVQSNLIPQLDPAFLDTVALEAVTSYRAISHYIMPLLSSDNDANGDMFTRRAARYHDFYLEEWQKLVLLPLYDFNQDTQFTNIERRGPTMKKLLRA